MPKGGKDLSKYEKGKGSKGGKDGKGGKAAVKMKGKGKGLQIFKVFGDVCPGGILTGPGIV